MTPNPSTQPEPDDMPDTPVFPLPDEAHIMPPLIEPYSEPDIWQAARIAYHASYCPCPDCENAEHRRNRPYSSF